MPFMRVLFFTVSMLVSTFLPGQSAFEIKYSKDVCSCLENKNLTKFNSKDFIECFQQVLDDDSALAMQEYKRMYGDTSLENGKDFGRYVIEKAQIRLIDECKPFFMLFDSLRYESINHLNQDSLKKQLTELKITHASNMDGKFYNEKAVLFFQLKMYDSSLHDVENVLRLDANNPQSLFMKAWINEIKGKYDEAIVLYDKVAALTNQNNFLIFSAIAKRKKNGM